MIYLSGCEHFQSSTLICYLFERVNVCRDIILPSILNVCILLCAYVARFWVAETPFFDRRENSFVVGDTTFLCAGNAVLYNIETTKYVVNRFCDRREIWLTANGPLCTEERLTTKNTSLY